MSPRREPDDDVEQQRRRTHANELTLAVAARLLGEARLVGAFPTEDAALAAFAARIAPELLPEEHIGVEPEVAPDLPRSDFKVTIAAAEADAVGFRCDYGGRWLHGRLRIDGVFDETGSGVGIGPGSPETRIELSPREEEVMRLVAARRKELGEAALVTFGGEEFRRALAVQPQPGAAAQILAVELYGDGLVVSYTYDDPVDVRPTIPLAHYQLAGVEPPLEELLAEAEEEGGNLEPDLSVTDDLGTPYRNVGGGQGWAEVAHGEVNFVPAVPAAATRLVISSYAGTVEVDL